MNKLLSALLAAAFITPAFAADTPKAAAPAATNTTEQVKGPAVGEIVTPQGNQASLNELIAKHKQESDAAKAKAAPAKK